MVYTVCIGSNEEREANLALARRRLAESFPGIRFSHEEETQPLALRRTAPFSNQLARFVSDWEQCEVCSRLKSIEREAGRLPGEKEREIVPTCWPATGWSIRPRTGNGTMWSGE